MFLPLSFFLVPSLFLPLVQYQMEMMRSLRHVNIDHLHVGWYQSTYYGSFVSRALLDSQFSYQHAIEESVVLIYGKKTHTDYRRVTVMKDFYHSSGGHRHTLLK